MLKRNSVFSIGDSVRLSTGWTRLIVVGFRNNSEQIKAVYATRLRKPKATVPYAYYQSRSIDVDKIRSSSQFVPWDGPENSDYLEGREPDGYNVNEQADFVRGPAELMKKEKTMAQLYEWSKDNVELFGTKIGENSAGMWIMEVKGDSVPAVVAPNLPKKVLPHTIEIYNFESGQKKIYKCAAGLVEKDDLVMLLNGQRLCSVTRVNCQSEKYSGPLPVCVKISGTLISAESDSQ